VSTAPGEQVETFRTADGVSLRLTRTLTGRRRVVLVAPGIFLHRESAEHRAVSKLGSLKALKRKGMSKSRAAAISNAGKKASRKGGKRGGRKSSRRRKHG